MIIVPYLRCMDKAKEESITTICMCVLLVKEPPYPIKLLSLLPHIPQVNCKSSKAKASNTLKKKKKKKKQQILHKNLTSINIAIHI